MNSQPTVVALQLAIRTLRGRAARARTLLIAVVGAVTCACVLTLPGAANVKGREAARVEALTAAPAAGVVSSTVHVHRGRHILIAVIDPRTTVALPGVAEPLAPGTMAVSPALRDRLASDSTLRRWFPYADAGSIGRGGVGSAGELRAYVAPERSRTAPEAAQASLVIGDVGAFGFYQAAGIAVFVVLPGVGLATVAGRFGRPTRRSRFRSLRVLGVPERACRAALAVEVAVPMAVGAAAACALATLALPDRFTLPLVERSVFSADLGLSPTVVVGAVAATSVVGALVGMAGVRHDDATDDDRRPGRRGTLRTLGGRASIVAFALGIVMAGWAWSAREPNDPRRWAAMALLGIGLPSAVAVITGAVAHVLARPEAPLSWLLAMRRAAADAPSATRFAGLASIGVFAFAAAQPTVQLIAQPGDSWTVEAHEAGAETVGGRAQSTDGTTVALRDLHAALPPDALVAIRLDPQPASQDGPPPARALVASCADIARLAQTPVPGCTGSPQPLVTSVGPPVGPPTSGTYHHPDGAGTTLTVAGPPLVIEPGPMPIDAEALIPPDALGDGADPDVTSVYFPSAIDATAWEDARADLVAAAPTFRLENAYEANASYDSTGSWVALGLVALALLTTTGAVLIGADDRARRAEWRSLRAVGFGRRRLVAVQASTALVGAMVGTAAATAAGTLLAAAQLRVNGESLPDQAPVLLAGVAATAAVVAVSVATAFGTSRSLG